MDELDNILTICAIYLRLFGRKIGLFGYKSSILIIFWKNISAMQAKGVSTGFPHRPHPIGPLGICGTK